MRKCRFKDMTGIPEVSLNWFIFPYNILISLITNLFINLDINFVEGETNENNCPCGSERITDETTCIKIANFLAEKCNNSPGACALNKYEYKKSVNSAAFLKGCMRLGHIGWTYFNTNSKGGMYGDGPMKAQVFCLKGKY